MGQIFRGLISAAINGLIILPLAAVFLAFYFKVSFESKLAFVNIALVLFVITLILHHHFSPQRARVIQTHPFPNIYLVEKGVARHYRLFLLLA